MEDGLGVWVYIAIEEEDEDFFGKADNIRDEGKAHQPGGIEEKRKNDYRVDQDSVKPEDAGVHHHGLFEEDSRQEEGKAQQGEEDNEIDFVRGNYFGE